jgi:hypothetical protein
MTNSIKYQTKVHFRCGRNGRKHLQAGDAEAATPDRGRVPRISRLMALAIRFDGLIRDGVVTDQADLARLGHVTTPTRSRACRRGQTGSPSSHRHDVRTVRPHATHSRHTKHNLPIVPDTSTNDISSIHVVSDFMAVSPVG